ncbi:hypothetical protein Verru16b_01326 [Lacunisphaera limnophila]|uniref:Uncharacterized protein n=1 Tax=Lacunisphaera limnophila TaxID=1838286 RepID=A0A1D8ATN4_9BACT|nr:hypothetical protein [Lacunisphaera limnophila]AOS44265.1 hypothetical protein Verru16b_01326 [Lacunisphaera limnophila]
MLPEFPRAKKRADELWMAAMMAGMRSDPFLAGIAIRVQKEGRRAYVDGSEMNYVPASVATTLKANVGRGETVEEFYNSAEALGKKMGDEQAKYLFKVMEQPSTTFQPFNFGPDVTIDDILGVWDKMFVRFKEGRPQWPQITSSAEVLGRLREIMEQSLQDPVSRAKWQALIDKKRKEYDEREARRRLVD